MWGVGNGDPVGRGGGRSVQGLLCRDLVEALNQAEVPTDSKLRSVENIFFPEDIRKVPATFPPPIANPFYLPEQLPTIQASSPNAEIPIGAGKGKEVQPQTKAKHSKDDLTIKDVVSKAKDAESESKVANPKEDPHQAKA